ncbi:MAG: hypothetical protein WBD47_06035 [Phormidesmis sp.]
MLISLWLRPVWASSLTDSRINQLEFQVRSLQTQINQLQTRSPDLRTGNAPYTPDTVSTAPRLNDPSFEEQFDNLATLVIELNQRVKVLESKLDETAIND